MTLIILTKNPKISLTSKETYKRLSRSLVKRNRGPSSVTSSLLRGLDGLHHPYVLNPRFSTIQKGDIVWVNESLDALRYAVHNKKEGTILIVGPNLVITPYDHNEIIRSKAIDYILQPSEWTKGLYISLCKELEGKIKLWPAGVQVPKLTHHNKREVALIYLKNIPPGNLLQSLCSLCDTNKLPYKIINYGKFKQQDYFDSLGHAKIMIYLSNSESQGLALQEAWARDVPTLVYSRGYFAHNSYSYKDPSISAPYLTQESGTFFNEKNVTSVFETFIKNLSSFSPRSYVEKNLSDEVCAKAFLSLLPKK